MSSDYLDAYDIKNEEVYLAFEMKSLSEEGGFRSTCYFTIVNGNSYYFYFRAYNPNILIDDLIKNGEVFLDGVKYTCRPEKKEGAVENTDSILNSSTTNLTSKTNITRTRNKSYLPRFIDRGIGAGIIVTQAFL